MIDRGEAYLVSGGDGEYSEYWTWPVAVFADADKAILTAVLLRTLAWAFPGAKALRRTSLEYFKRLDPNFEFTADYWVQPVPFEAHGAAEDPDA